MSVWEELPILEACVRESHRILFTGVVLRRNFREGFNIGGRVIKRGDFLAYSLSEVHLNPEYYPEPYKYDPGRWLRPDPVPNAPYPFLGWGAGRHPCVGMKVAKLEMKLVLATFLIGYEFDLVDKDGKFPDPLPVPDKNGFHRVSVGYWIMNDVVRWNDSSRFPRLPLSSIFLLELRAISTSRRLCSRRTVALYLTR